MENVIFLDVRGMVNLTFERQSKDEAWLLGWGPRWRYASAMGLLTLLLSLMMVGQHFN